MYLTGLLQRVIKLNTCKVLRIVTGIYEPQYVIKYNKYFFTYLNFLINLLAIYIAPFSFPQESVSRIFNKLSRIVFVPLNSECISGEI